MQKYLAKILDIVVSKDKKKLTLKVSFLHEPQIKYVAFEITDDNRDKLRWLRIEAVITVICEHLSDVTFKGIDFN